MIKELKFQLTFQDYKNFAKEQKNIKYLGLKKELILTHYVLFCFFMLLPIAAFIWISAMTHDKIFSFITVLVVLAPVVMCCIDYMFLFPLRYAYSCVKKDGKFAIKGNRNLILNTEDLTLKAKSFIEAAYVTYDLSKVHSIENSEYNILIFVTKQLAIIIPKRIFETEQEMNETWNLIQECYNKK